MELKPSPETDDFRYFDPKMLKPSEGGSSSAPKSRAPYQDAVVFMVGGGNYAEYQNLVDYAKVCSYLTVIAVVLFLLMLHQLFYIPVEDCRWQRKKDCVRMFYTEQWKAIC